MFPCHSSLIMFITFTSGSTTQYHITFEKSRPFWKIKNLIFKSTLLWADQIFISVTDIFIVLGIMIFYLRQYFYLYDCLITLCFYGIITSQVALVRSDCAGKACKNQRFFCENIGITQVVLRHDLKGGAFPQANLGLLLCVYVIIEKTMFWEQLWKISIIYTTSKIL